MTTVTQEKHDIDRRSFVKGAMAVATGAVMMGSEAVLAGPAMQAAGTNLVSAFVKGDVPATDPADKAWSGAKAVAVTLVPQNIAPPKLVEQSVKTLQVKSLNNGTQLAVHIEWEDASQDDVEMMGGHFRDAVAVQLPVKADKQPSVMMGNAGQPVYILQWKASWQAEVDSGKAKTIKDMFPNSSNLLMPEDILDEETAQLYYPGLHAGNPMSQKTRTSPVEELSAEGLTPQLYGALTSLEKQEAVGKGVYADGKWQVTIGIPMEGGTGRATLKGVSKTWLAFAAWDGKSSNRGSRKQYANWVNLEIAAK